MVRGGRLQIRDLFDPSNLIPRHLVEGKSRRGNQTRCMEK